MLRLDAVVISLILQCNNCLPIQSYRLISHCLEVWLMLDLTSLASPLSTFDHLLPCSILLTYSWMGSVTRQRWLSLHHFLAANFCIVLWLANGSYRCQSNWMFPVCRWKDPYSSLCGSIWSETQMPCPHSTNPLHLTQRRRDLYKKTIFT